MPAFALPLQEMRLENLQEPYDSPINDVMGASGILGQRASKRLTFRYSPFSAK